MKRNSKRSSILKPPKQIVRAPLQDLEDLPLDDEEGYTHTSSRRVSFSRTSQIKEFDPTMGCISVWNQNYEESLNAADSEESQITSPNGHHEILSVHLTKMNSRRKSFMVSQKGSSIETVEDESVQFSDARKVKQPRKSILSFEDTTSSEKGDMTKFLMEMNSTKSSKCTTVDVSAKKNLSVFEFSETEIIDSKVELSQITNKENLNTFIGNSDGQVKMSGNLAGFSGKNPPEFKPDTNAENCNSDMDMTFCAGGFQHSEADMEFTVPGGKCLQHNLGVIEKGNHPASREDQNENHTYTISKENIQNIFQNSDNRGAANVIKTVNSQSSVPVVRENRTTKDLLPKRFPCNENIANVGKNPPTNRGICPGSEEMGLTFLVERVEKLNVDPSYCESGRVEGPNDMNTETKSLTSILNPKEDHARATGRHCESNMDITVAYGGITNSYRDQIPYGDVNVHSQVMTETYSGEQGMELTVPLGKLNIGNRARTNEQLETSSRNYISEGTSGLSDALHLRLDKGNKPAKVESNQTDCASHMDLTTANGCIAVEHSVDDRTRNIDIQRQGLQQCLHDTRSTQPISLNEILGLNDNDEKSNTITLKTNPGNPVDNGNGYDDCIQGLDEICADMEGMELTVPLGRLKVCKAVEPSEKVIDSLSNDGKYIDSGEIVAGDSAKFGMADNGVGASNWRMNLTIIEDCDTLDETCGVDNGMDFTVPLGVIKERSQRDQISVGVNGGVSEVAVGDINDDINEKLESLDMNFGAECGMDFTVPLGKIKQNAGVQIACENNENVAELVNRDVVNNEEFETSNENCGIEIGMEFTVPLGRIALKNREEKGDLSRKNDEEPEESSRREGEITFSEINESLDETCGFDNGMEFTVPLGRIKVKNLQVPPVSVTNEGADVLQDVAVAGNHVILQPDSEISENVEGQPVGLKSLPKETFTNGAVCNVIAPSLGNQTATGEICREVAVESVPDQGDVTIGEEHEPIDEMWDAESGMEFTVPLGRIKERNLKANKECADIVHDYEEVAVAGNHDAESGMEFTVPLGRIKERNLKANKECAGIVHDYEDVAGNHDAESGMEFTVPLGRIKERNLKANKECADKVHEYEDVAVTGNHVVLQSNSENSANVEGQPDGLKSPQKPQIGSVTTPDLGNQITSGEVRSEGDVESNPEHEDVTIGEDHEPMDEMYDAESGMDFTVPLGRIKERLQKNINVSVHEEEIVEHVKMSENKGSDESEKEFVSTDTFAKHVAESAAVEVETNREYVHLENNLHHGEENCAPDHQTFKENCVEFMDVGLTIPEDILEAQDVGITAATSSMPGNSHVNRVELNDNHLTSIGQEEPRMEVVSPSITPIFMGSADLKDTGSQRTDNHKEKAEVHSHSLIEIDKKKLKIGGCGSVTSQAEPQSLFCVQDGRDSSPFSLCDIMSDVVFESNCDNTPEHEDVGTIVPSVIPFSTNAYVPTNEISDALMENSSDDIKVCMQNITVRSQKSSIGIETDEENPVYNPASPNQMESKGAGSNAESETCQPCESVERESMMSVSDDSDFDCDVPKNTEKEKNSPLPATENGHSMEEESIDVPLSEDATVCVQQWIQEESKRKSCPWLMHQMSDNQWSFLVFCRAIVLIINLKPVEGNSDSKDDRIVESVIISNALTENNDACIKLVSKIILSRFSSSMLTSKCMFSGQLPSLLEFLDAEFKPFRSLLKQLYKLDRCSHADFNNDGFCFRVTSMKLMLLFDVNVCVNNWNSGGVNPEDVTVTNYIGKTSISDFQRIVQGVKRDQDFLFNLYDAVLDFILDLERLL